MQHEPIAAIKQQEDALKIFKISPSPKIEEVNNS